MFQVNFLPWRARQLKRRYHFWRNLFLLQAIMLITGIMLISLLWHSEHLQQQVTIRLLLQQQKVLQTILLATQQGAEHLERIKARRRNHQKIQHQTYNYLILLQRLSRLIPDSCWLIKLEQHDDLLVLAGIGNNYTTIIAFLQKLVAEDNLFNIQLHNLNQQKKGELHFVIHVKGLYKMYNLQEKLRDE